MPFRPGCASCSPSPRRSTRASPLPSPVCPICRRLDLRGVLLATAGLLAVVYDLIEGQRYAWGAVRFGITIPEIIGAGVLLLLAFLVSQYRGRDGEPLLPFAVFADRNYTLMTLVLAAMGFAMLGLFLLLTIYFQSVLGLSAVAAELTIAPQPLTMLLAFPISNALVNHGAGKYVLMVGLLLFAAGMAFVAWQAHVESARWSFLPGLIAGGLGMACIWGPSYAIATRDLQPRLAGVASGVLNTIQELGGVIASASVGALLQNRLATALHAEALRSAAQLPPPYRAGFISGFSQAAQGGASKWVAARAAPVRPCRPASPPR